MKRNATLAANATYYIIAADGSTNKQVSFDDKRVALKGQPKDGLQYFITGLGFECFTVESNITIDSHEPNL